MERLSPWVHGVGINDCIWILKIVPQNIYKRGGIMSMDHLWEVSNRMILQSDQKEEEEHTYDSSEDLTCKWSLRIEAWESVDCGALKKVSYI